MSKFVVDHMEDGMHEWCVLEYKHMINVVGKENMYFTSLSDACLATMPDELKQAHCLKEGVLNLPGVDVKDICLLDPSATEPLKPEDADTFKYFLFGGILGDDPPRDRTKELRKLGFAGRHLGPVQMSTDTAVNVTKRVVDDRVPLNDIPYMDNPEVYFSKHESVKMPFRYIAQTKQVTTKDGEQKTIRTPIMPPGMLALLKKDSEQSFDF